jgi:hypothetical protein
MIGLLRADRPKATEFAPATEEVTGILPGLPAVAGKPVHVGFDGGQLTSDAGILLPAELPNGWLPAWKTRVTRSGCGTNWPR